MAKNITTFSRKSMDTYRLTLALESRGLSTISVEFLVLFLIIITALSGNALIFTALYRQPRLRTTSNYYILSLAVLDFVMAIATMPLTLGVIVKGKWLYGFEICQAQGFVVSIFGLSTVFIMVLISINRFVRLVKPDKYRLFFTTRKTLVSVIGAPLFGVTGTLVLGTTFSFHPGKLICFTHQDIGSLKSVLFFLICFICPFSIIGFCYKKVQEKIRIHQARVANISTAGRVNVAEIKATKGLFAIILAFLLCYLQIPCIDILALFVSLPRQAYVFYTYMAALSSAVNPFIYNATNSTFKTEVKKILGLTSDAQRNPQISTIELR